MIHKHVNSCISTQDILKSLIDENLSKDSTLKETLVVTCNEQTGGKGQKSNSWTTFPDSLAMSFAIMPNHQIQLTPIEIGILVSDFLDHQINADILLKWPNDLIYRDKKVGGILMELYKDYAVVGLGINFYTEDFENINFRFPATTLDSEKPEDLEEALIEFILNNRLQAPEEIQERFEIKCHHMKKELKLLDENISGKFIGINLDGSAKLEVDSEIKSIYSGSFLY